MAAPAPKAMPIHEGASHKDHGGAELNLGKHSLLFSVIPAGSARDIFESYALDAVDWFDPEKEHKALKSDVTNFIKDFQTTQMETHPSVGLGTDCRMESKKITGFALTLDDQALHLCIFYKDNEQRSHEFGSRIRRFSTRRRNRN